MCRAGEVTGSVPVAALRRGRRSPMVPAIPPEERRTSRADPGSSWARALEPSASLGRRPAPSRWSSSACRRARWSWWQCSGPWFDCSRCPPQRRQRWRPPRERRRRRYCRGRQRPEWLSHRLGSRFRRYRSRLRRESGPPSCAPRCLRLAYRREGLRQSFRLHTGRARQGPQPLQPRRPPVDEGGAGAVPGAFRRNAWLALVCRWRVPRRVFRP